MRKLFKNEITWSIGFWGLIFWFVAIALASYSYHHPTRFLFLGYILAAIVFFAGIRVERRPVGLTVLEDALKQTQSVLRAQAVQLAKEIQNGKASDFTLRMTLADSIVDTNRRIDDLKSRIRVLTL